MKKFNWLMMLLTAFAFSFAACTETPDEPGKPDDPVTPEDPVTEELTFNVEVGEISYSAVNFVITPSDLEADYVVALYNKATVDEFTSDEYLLTSLYTELEADARYKGKTLKEYMVDVIDRGVLEGSFEELAPETEYYILVFGVDAEKDYRASTEVTKVPVTTAAAPKIEITFEINTTVDGNTAQYEIIPSDNEATWYFYTVPLETYQAYTDPEWYDMSDVEFVLYAMQQDINGYLSMGYTNEQVIEAIFHQGALTLEADKLNANTDYIGFVAAFDVTEDGTITIISDITFDEYTTGDAKKKDLTFDISVTDIEAVKAAIKITPSNNNDKFCWMVSEWDGVMTAEEIMLDIVERNGSWMQFMTYSGVQDYTGGPGSPYKFSLDSPDTDHYVVAFGYEGGITTDCAMVTFHTLAGPPEEDCTFEVSASKASPYSFDMTVTPSDNLTLYDFNVFVGEFDETAYRTEMRAAVDESWEMYHAMNPTFSYAAFLGNMFWRGSATATAQGLDPEITYSAYVASIDLATGDVVNVFVFEDFATTLPLGSVTPTIEHIGYYSGDDEAGTIFGDANLTAGRAFSVVKYNNIEGAQELYAGLLWGDYSNSTEYSDAVVWSEGKWYWKKHESADPYTFYLTWWESVETAVAYAVDADGLPGGIGRAYSLPTADNKGDIEELRALVDELNAESEKAYVLPESVVVDFKKGIHLTDIVCDKGVVEAAQPAMEPKAEVKAAQPAIVANKVVAKNAPILPFYLHK